MQNKYLLKKNFISVLSLSRTRTTVSPLPQVAVYCANPWISRWMGNMFPLTETCFHARSVRTQDSMSEIGAHDFGAKWGASVFLYIFIIGDHVTPGGPWEESEHNVSTLGLPQIKVIVIWNNVCIKKEVLAKLTFYSL